MATRLNAGQGLGAAWSDARVGCRQQALTGPGVSGAGSKSAPLARASLQPPPTASCWAPRIWREGELRMASPWACKGGEGHNSRPRWHRSRGAPRRRMRSSAAGSTSSGHVRHCGRCRAHRERLGGVGHALVPLGGGQGGKAQAAHGGEGVGQVAGHRVGARLQGRRIRHSILTCIPCIQKCTVMSS